MLSVRWDSRCAGFLEVATNVTCERLRYMTTYELTVDGVLLCHTERTNRLLVPIDKLTTKVRQVTWDNAGLLGLIPFSIVTNSVMLQNEKRGANLPNADAPLVFNWAQAICPCDRTDAASRRAGQTP